MQRLIVVGDVHGCVDELRELMGRVGPVEGDRVVMLGDLIDRGPDPVGTVRLARESGWGSVMGNHEEKALRWLRNEALRATEGRPNRMTPPREERRREWEALSPEDLDWMRDMPPVIAHGDWLLVHAGFEPAFSLEDQRTDKVMRVRFVGEDGKSATPTDEWRMPEGAVPWDDAWDDERHVMFGHAVRSVEHPSVNVRGRSKRIGMDTGCVFGGRLTAAVVEGDWVEFVQVRARRTYFAAPHGGPVY